MGMIVFELVSPMLPRLSETHPASRRAAQLSSLNNVKTSSAASLTPDATPSLPEQLRMGDQLRQTLSKANVCLVLVSTVAELRLPVRWDRCDALELGAPRLVW